MTAWVSSRSETYGRIRTPAATGVGSERIRVLHIDPHPLIRAGLVSLLERFPDLCLIEGAHDSHELADEVTALRPDVVLMELRLTTGDSLALMAGLVAQHPSLRVIVLANTATPAQVASALEAGASGYLLKDADGFAIARAIRAVHNGRTVLAPEASEALARHVRPAPHAICALSAREREVLQLLVTGMSNNELSAALHVSRATIKYHLLGIFQKLGVRNRAEAIAYAYQHQLVL
jgi:DNA-binding NarL/FixJ family response regulator